VKPGSVRAAEEAGVGFVPQVSLLAEGLSVAENIVLGREPRSMGCLVSRRRAYVESAMLIERFGFRLDPDAIVASLTASERRQAEIARALARGGNVLVLDEPTSILSESEAGSIFALLGRLAEAGRSIVLVTHRLSEVLKEADSITVLREGRVVADMSASEADVTELSRLMARHGAGGQSEDERASREMARVIAAMASDPPAFEFRDIRLAPGARPLNFAIRPGEALAIVALAGNGLGRLEDYASGMTRPAEGEVLICGEGLGSIPRPSLRPELMAYVPSDREGRGLCLPVSIRENALALRGKDFPMRDWMGHTRRDRMARESSSIFGLEADPRRNAATLSGGNRQRLLLARELDRPRRVLLLAEPLQGLDLAAQKDVSKKIQALREQGSAALILVSNIEDALVLADRVIALYRGEAVFEGTNGGLTIASLLLGAITGSYPLDSGRDGA
jgi:simple sugar transport system ATP-binding protein